jgi:hypothetical protein
LPLPPFIVATVMIELVTSASSPSVKATNPSNQSYRFLGELPTGEPNTRWLRPLKLINESMPKAVVRRIAASTARNTGRTKGVASLVAPPSRRVPLNVDKRPWDLDRETVARGPRVPFNLID